MIEENYTFSPTAFENGMLHKRERTPACVIQAAEIQTVAATLYCFGAYCRKKIMRDPDGTNHQNIRNPVETGQTELHFMVKL
jgi:hypothetical protein